MSEQISLFRWENDVCIPYIVPIRKPTATKFSQVFEREITYFPSTYIGETNNYIILKVNTYVDFAQRNLTYYLFIGKYETKILPGLNYWFAEASNSYCDNLLYWHPHISKMADPCLGEAGSNISVSINKGNLCNVYLLLSNFLKTYSNTVGFYPYIALENFREVKSIIRRVNFIVNRNTKLTSLLNIASNVLFCPFEIEPFENHQRFKQQFLDGRKQYENIFKYIVHKKLLYGQMRELKEHLSKGKERISTTNIASYIAMSFELEGRNNNEEIDATMGRRIEERCRELLNTPQFYPDDFSTKIQNIANISGIYFEPEDVPRNPVSNEEVSNRMERSDDNRDEEPEEVTISREDFLSRRYSEFLRNRQRERESLRRF